MSATEHAKLCLLVCALTLLLLGLGVFPGLTEAVGQQWALAAVAALIGTFISSQLLSKKVFGPARGNEQFGATKREAAAVVLSVWLPALLGIAVIAALMLFDVAPNKVAWVLVSVAGMVGHHLSSLKDFKGK